MPAIWTMGELLVEVMRPRPGLALGKTGPFLGPYPSGAPGIFIDTVARLGHSAAIVSGVGDDEFGRCIVDRLRADGVDVECIEVFPDRATGVAFVAYADDGSRRFIFHWDGTPAVMAHVPDPSRVESAQFFHVMGCSLMANDEFRRRVVETLELFASHGARVSFDPNIRSELLRGRPLEEIVRPVLRLCSYLLPGEAELAMLSGKDDPGEAAGVLFGKYPIEAIILKRGAAGCSVIKRDGRIDLDGFKIREVDPTGAGDCFDGGFLCGLLEGKDLAGSALLGAAVGAINAEAFGPMEGRINPRSVAAMQRRRRSSR